MKDILWKHIRTTWVAKCTPVLSTQTTSSASQSTMASSPLWDSWPYCSLYSNHHGFGRHGASSVTRGLTLAKSVSLIGLHIYLYSKYNSIVADTGLLLQTQNCYCRYRCTIAYTGLLLQIQVYYCIYRSIIADTGVLLHVQFHYCKYRSIIADIVILLQMQFCYCRYMSIIADTGLLLQIQVLYC